MRSSDAAASDSEALRPASIAPSRTVLALAFLAAFTILLVGCARGISAVGAQCIARGILLLGVVVALVGIIQKAVGSEAVYGLWYPPKGGVRFAPLINANHFAGWMVLVRVDRLFRGWCGAWPSGREARLATQSIVARPRRTKRC